MSFRELKRSLRWKRDLFRRLSLGDAVRVFLAELAGGRRRLAVRVGGETLVVRTGTYDLLLAFRGLIDGEYHGIELDDVHGIIDAGAHTGTAALALARRFPEATVIAVEPEAENFELLRLNTAHNPRIVPVRAALAADPGEARLLDRGTGPWGYTVVEGDGAAADLGQTVRCVTVPGLMAEHGLPALDVLKLDIEGGEKAVLEGSSAWIGRVRVLIAELHERIVPGCEAAFEAATSGFTRVVRSQDKHVAYADGEPQ